MYKFDFFILGVNYWPRKRGVNIWKEWHPEEIEKEFSEMASIGLNACRIFLVWEDFQPIKEIRGYRDEGEPIKICFQKDESKTDKEHPEMIDEETVAKFDALVQIAKKNKIMLIPTLLVGWMSGMLLDVNFRRGRNIFTDPTMMKYQVWYLRYFARRYRNEDAILAWDLGNEQDCFMRSPSHDAGWLWTYVLTKTLKSGDPNHLVTSGMHGLGIFKQSKESFLIRDVAENTDFTCVHPYPLFSRNCCIDKFLSLRTTYLASWQSSLYQGVGKKPALCEEFGTLGDSFLSEEKAALYIRTVLYSLLSNNDLGAIWWCHTDFTCTHLLPYEANQMESDNLGLFDKKGKPKPAAREFKEFSKVANKINYPQFQKTEKQAAIVIPVYTESYDEVLFNSYILTKQAGIEADLISPEEDYNKYKLLVLPSIKDTRNYTITQWDRMKTWIKKGGVLYLSYDGGSLTEIKEVFGLEIITKDRPREKGRRFKMGNEEFCSKTERSVEIKVTKGKVIARDDLKRPVIVENNYGEGKTVFCAEGIEKYLSLVPNVYDKDNTYKIYSYLEDLAQITYELEIDCPFVERTIHKLGDKRLFIVVNHESKKIETEAASSKMLVIERELVKNTKVHMIKKGKRFILPINLGANEARIYVIA